MSEFTTDKTEALLNRIAELDVEVFELSDALDDKNKRITGLEEYAEYRESKALKLYDRIAELESQLQEYKDDCQDALREKNEDIAKLDERIVKLEAVIKSAPLPVSDDRNFWIQYGEWKGKALQEVSDDGN